MIVFKRTFTTALCMLLMQAIPAAANAVECHNALSNVDITASHNSFNLSDDIAHYGETGSHSPVYLAGSARWCMNEGGIWSFAGEEKLHWFGVNLTNHTNTPIKRVFSLDAPLFDHATLYTIKSGNGHVEVASRDTARHRDKLGFTIQIPAGETIAVLFSIEAGRFQAGASLMDMPSFMESISTRNLIVSLMMGALFCMLVFQVLLAAASREHLPLTLLVLSVFAYESVKLGYVFVVLGDGGEWLARYKVQLEYLVIIAATVFTSAFFEVSARDRRLLSFFQISCGLLVLTLLLSLASNAIAARAMQYVALLPLGLLIATTIERFMHARNYAVLFLLAWLPAMAGFIVSRGIASGTVAYQPVPLLASDIGMSISMLLLVILVSHRLETRRRSQELDLRNTQRRYQLALEGSNDGIFEWDLVRGLVLASQRAHEITGVDFQPGWRSQKVWYDVLPETERDRITRMRDAMFVDDDLIRAESWCLNDRGEKVYLLLQGKLDFDGDGNPVRIIGSVSDISEQKHLEKRLRHDALHDFLTGLPNRTLLTDRIQRVVERLKRNPDSRAALLFIDLDNFKAINDNLGHGFGDQVLVSLAERLLELVRSSDTVARLGGDEFVILLEDMFSHREAERFANRLLGKVHTPIDIRGHHLIPSISIGMTLVEDPNISVETVLGDADIAMYAAKERGKGRVVAFEATMRTRAAKRLEIESALHQAMENQELYLAYQPIFSLETTHPEAVGVEALLRWSRAEREDIAPSELLTLAEENGMIEDIGKWVVREAAKQLAEWRAQDYPEDFYINVNLSAVHFENEDIVSIILNELDPRGVPRNALRIEIVESAVIRHPEKALSVIKLLQSQGILVSIDDFGTGFSSLSYLHRFPFYALKIDRSFVMEIAESKATRDIVTAIVVLARRLGIRVVAEGIENEAQLKFLRNIGCDLGQGFLLARPAMSGSVDKFFQLPLAAQDFRAASPRTAATPALVGDRLATDLPA